VPTCKSVRSTIVLCLATALVGCHHHRGASEPKQGELGAWVSMSLPALDGGEIDLTSYRGRIVIMHFFTTWSLGAQVDVTELQKTRDALPKDSVVLLGVGLDPDGYKLIAPFRDAAGIDYTVLLPTQEMIAGESQFGDLMATVPDTFVIDREGRLRWEWRGPLRKGQLLGVVRNLETHEAPP
jgi:peroxiredoxin